MKLLRLRKLHRWVALFVGLQLLLWTTSGLVFAWLEPAAVSGEALVATPPPLKLAPDTRFVEPGRLLDAAAGHSVEGVRLQPVGRVWCWRVETDTGVQLHRASDGAVYRLDEPAVRQLALDHYRGPGRLTAVRHHAKPTLEVRDSGATWQADFDDAAGTSLYFSADDGALVATRTDTWRVRDVFWMLHTMDYRGRDDFNNPLVVLAGTAAAWVALTGLWLLVRVLRPRRA
jgi:hypothetical protein